MHESQRIIALQVRFQQVFHRYGVTIKLVRASNGVYTSKVNQCSKQHQLSCCAVGVHWQNDIAEQFNGSDLMTMGNIRQQQ